MKKYIYLFILMLFSTVNYIHTAQHSQYDSGLVLLYHFNNGSGSTVSDMSVYKASSTMDGGIDTTGWVTGKYGYGLQFDGIDDRIRVLWNSQFNNTPLNQWTIECWVLHLSSNTSFIEAFIRHGGNFGYLLRSNYGSFESRLNMTPTGTAIRSTPSVIVLNKWQHFAMTYDGRFRRHYVNGILKNTWDEGVSTVLSFTGVAFIGIGGDATAVIASPMNGIIDEVAMYNRCLAGGEIKNHFINNKPKKNAE